MSENLLLQESLSFGTPFESVPFGMIHPEHYLEAIEYWSRVTDQRREQIISVIEPTFVSVIEPLERITAEIDRISQIFGNLRLAEDTPELREIAPEVIRKMTELGHSIALDKRVFAQVAEVYQNEKDSLTGEQKTLLEKTYKDFVRAGAELEGESKQRFQAIEIRLGDLALEFGNRVLADQNAFVYELQESQLAGLSPDWIESAAREAQERGLEGWIVTLDYPSMIPFLANADDREARQAVQTAFVQVGNQDNDYSTREIVREIAQLRAEKAQILGFDHHAAYVLDNRMAQNLETAQELLGQLYQAAHPQAERDIQQVKDFARERDGLTDFASWDYSYYKEKLKHQLYSLDDEVIKQYFPLSGVIDSLFGVAGDLYGLQFVKTTEVTGYHPDVEVYVVTEETGEHVGLLYIDLYSRAGKSAGAWMTEYRSQWKELSSTGDLVNQRPHISFVMSVSRPGSTGETLLNLREVETAFHEFGHSLHGLLSNGRYASISGTNVLWDFVELPSQLMENWVSHPEFLQRYAKHYQTGESMPQKYQEAIARLRSFHEGAFSLRQLRFSALDFAWYTQSPDGDFELDAIEQSIAAEYDVLPAIEGSATSTQFAHIFRGGYSAGYYSYKWAEVLDADVFDRFAREGIFSRELGQQFREKILSRGGSQHSAELYREFMGRDPEVGALLRRAGFTSE